MAIVSLSDIFKIGVDVLTTSILDNGTLVATNGDVITSQVSEDTTEIWGMFGFSSRPSKAVQGENSAQMIAITQGDRDIAIAGRDLRAQPIYGNLGEGESVMFATGPDGHGQARIACKGNGAIVLYTTDNNVDTGNGVYLQVAPNNLKFAAPWGSLVFDKTGFHMVTSAGSRIDIGGMVGIPGLNSYAKMTASMISMIAPAVMLGPDTVNGGLGYMPAAYGLLPGPKFTPILGVGVGAVTVASSASTCVYVAP